MKKVALILLSVSMLLVSCAKQTTITTEKTDSYTENLTEPTTTASELVTEAPEPTDNTEPGEVPTEEPTEASEPSSEATEPSETPTEPSESDSEQKEGIYADLEEVDIPVIGEYVNIEEAFAGYDLQTLSRSDMDSFWSEFEEENSVEHKEAFFLDDRTDMGFLVKVIDSDNNGFNELVIDELYAFNKLYDVDYDKSRLYLLATDDVLVVSNSRKVLLIYSDAEYLLYQDPQIVKDEFTYSARVHDGKVRYYRARYVTRMQSFYDWAIEYWYPGYGDELALECGSLTRENGELIFTPDETYTVEEWLMGYAHMEEKMQKTGYDSLDEYMEAYLYGGLNPRNKS